MTDRRTEILDGALHVLAEQGMRGLTHRAVDGAAGIAAGSTSYYFRSRAALVAGCVARLLELDLQVEVPSVQRAAADVDTLAGVLTEVGVAMATTRRHRTLARYELSLAAAREPELRADLVRGGDTIRGSATASLQALGATDPDRAAAELAAALDGLVLGALVRGPHDPAELATWLEPALRRVLCAQPGVGSPRGVHARPGSDQPGSDQPGSGQPGSDRPGSGQPGSDRPGSDRPGSGQPGSGQPGSGQP